jgi:RNA polymerase sigma-70 factor (ECF subfamily)
MKAQNNRTGFSRGGSFLPDSSRDHFQSHDPPMTDEQLMREFQSGQERAFQELFGRYSKFIINFAYRFLNSREAAEDVAQEVLLRVYKGRDRYNPSRPFRPWIFSIAARLCSNKLRDLKRKPTASLDFKRDEDDDRASLIDVVPEKSSLSPEASLEKRETILVVREALTNLPEAQRTAVLLAKYEEMSYDEIAAVLKTSVPSVKSLLFRGRETLKRLLRPYVQEKNKE